MTDDQALVIFDLAYDKGITIAEACKKQGQKPADFVNWMQSTQVLDLAVKTIREPERQQRIVQGWAIVQSTLAATMDRQSRVN